MALKLLHDLIEIHVMAADRLHGDDTPVPVLARGKCATGRAWVYVRDDKPFGGPDPLAALFRYSRNRSGDHPVEHLRNFADIAAGKRRGRHAPPISPLAMEAVKRIDALFDIERGINGETAPVRLAPVPVNTTCH